MYLLTITYLMFKLILCKAYYNPCDGIVFLNKYYEKQILFGGLHKPSNLVMHELSDSVFFSHTIRRGTHLDFGIRVCHLTTMECKNIKEVIGGRALAYDRKKNEMYLGGRKGIYKYNFMNKTAQFFAEKGKAISNLFIQKHLFYIDANTKKLFVYENNNFTLVTEVSNIAIDIFFVSKRFVMYYSNTTALYTAPRPVKPAMLLDNNIHVRQITQDYTTDFVFFAASEGIYYLNDDTDVDVKKAGEIIDIFGLAFLNTSDSEFEPGQLIFSNKNAIITLVPGKYGDQCLDIKSNKSWFYVPDKMRKPSPKLVNKW